MRSAGRFSFRKNTSSLQQNLQVSSHRFGAPWRPNKCSYGDPTVTDKYDKPMCSPDARQWNPRCYDAVRAIIGLCRASKVETRGNTVTGIEIREPAWPGPIRIPGSHGQVLLLVSMTYLHARQGPSRQIGTFWMGNIIFQEFDFLCFSRTDNRMRPVPHKTQNSRQCVTV